MFLILNNKRTTKNDNPNEYNSHLSNRNLSLKEMNTLVPYAIHLEDDNLVIGAKIFAYHSYFLKDNEHNYIILDKITIEKVTTEGKK